MMTRDEARQAIVDEWLRLHADDRATEDQAALFAMKAPARYEWNAAGDAYQEVMAWLSAHIGKP